MLLTREQAVDIANRQLLSLGCADVPMAVLPKLTEEFDVGWVFYYQSERYLQTGNFSDTLVGNAPLFVSRLDGQCWGVSHHRPLTESLAAYRACGNPNAREIAEVRLAACKKDAQVVFAIRAIRQHSALGLSQAKSVVESCLANLSPIVAVSTVEEARALVTVLASFGFQAAVRYDNP